MWRRRARTILFMKSLWIIYSISRYKSITLLIVFCHPPPFNLPHGILFRFFSIQSLHLPPFDKWTSSLRVPAMFLICDNNRFRDWILLNDGTHLCLWQANAFRGACCYDWYDINYGTRIQRNLQAHYQPPDYIHCN